LLAQVPHPKPTLTPKPKPSPNFSLNLVRTLTSGRSSCNGAQSRVRACPSRVCSWRKADSP
jgi:hypothetical protein